MNKQEILTVLKDACKVNDVNLDNHVLPDALEEVYYYGTPKQPEGYVINLEKQHGGEGQGDDYYLIFGVKPKTGDTVFIRFDGWYASHHGHEFENGDDFNVVKKKQVEVTQYV